MKTNKSFLGRLTAGVGALALAAAGAVGISTVAFADNGGEDPEPTVADVANIDVSEQGNLHIHKYDGNPGEAGNGTEIANTSGFGNPLEGVTFSVWEVNFNGVPIDLSTYQGWVDAQGATVTNVSDATDGYSLGALVDDAVTTGTGGLATFTPAAGADGFRLYYVSETDPGSNLIVAVVPDFLVSIPYPNAAEWLYDVHVYPKNKIDTDVPGKEVTDPGSNLVVGDTLTWTITKTLPVLTQGATFQKVVITDTLDARLSITPADVTVSVDGTELTQGTDYTATVAGQLVTVTFTGALADLVGDENIVVTLDTKVESLGDAEFANTAFVNVNDAEQETNEPKVYWGSLKLLKQDNANQKPLAGAGFELYAADKTARIGSLTYTTDDDGEIVIEGLWVGTNPSDTETYCLKEVTAPAGYVLPEGDDAWTCFTVTADGLDVVVETVNNHKQGGPNLPLTGSTGTVLFTLLGVGLIGAGAGTLALRRRKAAH